jgi:hypothetical protein
VKIIFCKLSCASKLTARPARHHLYVQHVSILQHREQKKATARGIIYVSAGGKKTLRFRNAINLNRKVVCHV